MPEKIRFSAPSSACRRAWRFLSVILAPNERGPSRLCIAQRAVATTVNRPAGDPTRVGVDYRQHQGRGAPRVEVNAVDRHAWLFLARAGRLAGVRFTSKRVLFEDEMGSAIPWPLSKVRAVFQRPMVSLAETEGFEPSVPLTRYDDLANRCLQPLGHVSGRRDAIAVSRTHGNRGGPLSKSSAVGGNVARCLHRFS